jgi:hypothetical protein
MNIATIIDQPSGTFGLEYDNTLGKKNVMRLEATTYERALQEARSFLGIKEDGYDAEGKQWELD